MRSLNRNMILLAVAITLIGFIKVAQFGFAISDVRAMVMNFEQCVAVGNPIMESHPRQCQSATGVSFVEDIGGANDDLALSSQ